eukprot:scaffold81088_cov60-Cyclotella_meneghiniana.AAC.9
MGMQAGVLRVEKDGNNVTIGRNNWGDIAKKKTVAMVLAAAVWLSIERLNRSNGAGGEEGDVNKDKIITRATITLETTRINCT